MSTKIQSGAGSDLATVDTTHKALHVLPKGTGTVEFSHDNYMLDSFERLRVSEPRNVFEHSFAGILPATQNLIWETAVTASGTFALTANLYGTDLNTTTSATSGAWIQSNAHVRYAPGISTVLRFTFNFNNPQTGSRSRVGMFSDQGTFPSVSGDGLYLEADGQAISVVRRYMTTGTGAEERVLQSNWNLDKMNGTGASGVNLDWTKAQHLVIEYQWLGVGTIRFGFETNQGLVWAHEMVSVNALTQSWSRTGTLPVRAETYNTGLLAATGRLTLINVVVQQEGDVEYRWYRYFGATSGATAKVSGTANGLYPTLSIRALSTNDITKRTTIIPTSIDVTVAVVATGATSLQVALLMVPTPNTGATFAVNNAGSSVSVDQAANSTTAVTGTPIATWTIPNIVGRYSFDLATMKDNINRIGYNAAGTVAITGQSVLCLAVGPLSGTTTVGSTVVTSINWKEIV